MRKEIKTACLITLLAFGVTGCTKDETPKKITCTLENKNVVSNYTLNSTYNINYVGKTVKSVETVEKVTSTDENIIKTFESTFNETYSKLDKEYGGYVFEVKTENDSVTSTVSIDYSKMDLDKLVKDQPSMKDSMNEDNELLVSRLQESYEAMGATCSEVK